ncbi:MAG: hypothetical protein KDB62_03945 [Solirubrobacterales bacterium]|nr:hypothetical protein [Solirubrobacterales bacterium]
MKQRLAAALVMIAALLVAALGLAAPASADDATTSATSAEKKANKAKKQKNKKCNKYKKVKKNKGASKKQKNKAKKSCNKAKKNLKKANKKVKKQNAQYFDVCKHGCKYNTIQKGVNAAGEWQKKKNGKANPDKVNKTVATVRVQPGTYTEGVLIHGSQKGMNFNGLKIIGVKNNLKPNPNARKVILQGKNAKTVVKGTPGWVQGDPTKIAANNAIEARNVDDIVFKNMWAKNYLNNTFFVWASNLEADNEHCADFVMDNLVSSDTKSYGLFSRNCYGGKFLNSEGWNHGDSALYIGETPCDEFDWTNKGPNPGPCQADPNWTIVKNMTSHQNSLGYSGTNSKYVKIMDSNWYNNGAGIVPNTLDSEKFEPSGQLILENNNIFWNNYNYYSDGSTFTTVIGNGNPTGIGIMLYGTDGVVAKNNNIFGNEQWGAATFSGPELFEVNEGDDAKNMNNQFIDNNMGRNGVDPNGNYDFFSDASGGGNCWSGNNSSTFAPGNGSVPVSTIYPACPQPTVINDDVSAVDFGAGLQINTAYLSPLEPWRDLTTIFGLAEVRPSSLQECSWNITSPHPSFSDNGVTYKEERALPVGDQACQELEDRP